MAFTLLRFLNSDALYLHAQVTLCDKQASRPCQPVSGVPEAQPCIWDWTEGGRVIVYWPPFPGTDWVGEDLKRGV